MGGILANQKRRNSLNEWQQGLWQLWPVRIFNNGVEMFEKSGINRICDIITEFQQHS